MAGKIMFIRKTNVHDMVPISSNWDRELYLNDFATTTTDNTGVQVAVNTRKGTKFPV